MLNSLVGGGLVQFLDSTNVVRSMISPTIDFSSVSTGGASICAGALT